jgi:hypothetical protein
LPSTPGKWKSGATDPIGRVVNPGGSATAAPVGRIEAKEVIVNILRDRFIVRVSRCRSDGWVDQYGSVPAAVRDAKWLGCAIDW